MVESQGFKKKNKGADRCVLELRTEPYGGASPSIRWSPQVTSGTTPITSNN